MAFRRNRAPRKAFRFARGRRRNYTWATGIYINEGVTLNATPNEFALFNHNDFAYTGTVTQPGPHKIHRLQFKGGVSLAMAQAAQAVADVPLMWAVYISDDDDTDTEMWQATGSIFSAHQILKYKVQKETMSEIPAATQTQYRMPAYPINFDMKFRKPKLLLADHAVILNIEFGVDVQAVVAAADLWGVTRIVCQPAGMGA